jgi:hypothetical protein
MQIAKISSLPATLPRGGDSSSLRLATAQLAIGLGLGIVATFFFRESSFALLLLAVAGGFLLAATIASRYAALALLGLLLVGNVGLSVDFAKTSVSLFGLPLYVTDFLLAPVIAGSIMSARCFRREALPLVLAVAAFSAMSALSAAVSLIDGRDLQLVLYQGLPLFYYPLSALCVAWNIDLRSDKALVLRFAVSACILAVGNGLYRAATGQFALTEQDVPRYLRGDSGTFLGASFVALLIQKRRALGSEIWMFCASAALLGGVLLSEHRSVWLATALAFGVTWLLAPSTRSLARASTWAGILVLGLLVGGLLLEADAISGTLDRILSTFDTYSVNANYRLAAWDASLDEVAANPITGSGFGKLFVFYNRGLEYVGAPHNSLVNIAWYLGVPGLAVFLAVQTVFLARVFRRRFDLARHGWSHAAIFGAWLSLIIVAVFNVILESPVGAIPFWLVVGLPFGTLVERTHLSHQRPRPAPPGQA